MTRAARSEIAFGSEGSPKTRFARFEDPERFASEGTPKTRFARFEDPERFARVKEAPKLALLVSRTPSASRE